MNRMKSYAIPAADRVIFLSKQIVVLLSPKSLMDNIHTKQNTFVHIVASLVHLFTSRTVNAFQVNRGFGRPFVCHFNQRG